MTCSSVSPSCTTSGDPPHHTLPVFLNLNGILFIQLFQKIEALLRQPTPAVTRLTREWTKSSEAPPIKYIDFSRIHLDRKLGSGQFGDVWKANVNRRRRNQKFFRPTNVFKMGLNENKKIEGDVAIKTVHQDAPPKEHENLIQEAIVMAKVRTILKKTWLKFFKISDTREDLNIVKWHGMILNDKDQQSAWMCIEYMAGGALNSFLKSCQTPGWPLRILSKYLNKTSKTFLQFENTFDH